MITIKPYRSLTVDIIAVEETTTSKIKPNLYKRVVEECSSPTWSQPSWYVSVGDSCLQSEYKRLDQEEEGMLEKAFQGMIEHKTRAKG